MADYNGTDDDDIIDASELSSDIGNRVVKIINQYILIQYYF